MFRLTTIFIVCIFTQVAICLCAQENVKKDIGVALTNFKEPAIAPIVSEVSPIISINSSINIEDMATSNVSIDLHFRQMWNALYIPVQHYKHAIFPLYPGVSHYQNYGGNLGQLKIAENLSLNYGAFISHQSAYLSGEQKMVVGGNFLFNYAIAPKLYLQGYGQYVTKDVMPSKSKDPIFSNQHFFPGNHMGIGVVHHTNKRTKLKMGVEYQFNESEKKWKANSGGKVSLGF